MRQKSYFRKVFIHSNNQTSFLLFLPLNTHHALKLQLNSYRAPERSLPKGPLKFRYASGVGYMCVLFAIIHKQMLYFNTGNYGSSTLERNGHVTSSRKVYTCIDYISKKTIEDQKLALIFCNYVAIQRPGMCCPSPKNESTLSRHLHLMGFTSCETIYRLILNN